MAKRKFTREFKTSAAKLVNEQDYSVSESARSLGVDPIASADGFRTFRRRLAPTQTHFSPNAVHVEC
jgi:transposase-like protein